MVRMVAQQEENFDHILDEVSDDDEDHQNEDVNMEETEGDNNDNPRAPPAGGDRAYDARREMDDEPPLEGYQR